MAYMFARKVGLRRLVTASFCSIVSIAAAGAVQAQSPFMPLGRTTLAPHGFLQFCRAEPEQCGLPAVVAAPATEKQQMQEQWAAVFGSPAPQPVSSASAAPSETALMQKQWAAVFRNAATGATPAAETEVASIDPPPQTGVTAPTAAPESAPSPEPSVWLADMSDLHEQPTSRQPTMDGLMYAPTDHYADAGAPLVVELAPAMSGAPDIEAGEFAETAITMSTTEKFRPTTPYSLAMALYVDPVLARTSGQTVTFQPVASAAQDAVAAAPAADLSVQEDDAGLSNAATQEDEAAPPAAPDSSSATASSAEPTAPLRLDNRLMEQLTLTNARVNAAITPMTDVEAFGFNDVWTLPIENGGKARGNCKHYALEKQHALLAAGLPAADLSLAIVRTSWGEMHAVLLVRTDRGELVLDNLTGAVMSWRDVDYTWLERQAPGDPMSWVSVAAASAAVARG